MNNNIPEIKNEIGYNGKFPTKAVLAFHRESYGIYDGKVNIEITFQNGEVKCINVSRKSGRVKNAN
jgi:hypothetical protein